MLPYLSVRYINDRFLPDKAIDLIDEASSRARLKSYIEPEKLKNMQEQLEEIKRNKEEAVLNQKFEKAAKLKMWGVECDIHTLKDGNIIVFKLLHP